MPASKTPSRVTVRAYKVGFGDCFLLTFHYGAVGRHVLIDFGTAGTEDDDTGALMLRIAEDIRQETGGKLHAVVATHRHKDHISGFATKKNGKGSGDIIASLKPDVVIQPWTEDPDAAVDATKATKVEAGPKAFVASLTGMQAFCNNLVGEMPALQGRLGQNTLRQLSFLGEDNLANLSAVKNLQSMGRKNFFVNFGSRCGLNTVLPGVTTHVLGPPDLEQTEQIRKQRARDAAEFWHLLGMAEGHAAAAKVRLFPDAAVYRDRDLPPHTRWFIEKIQKLRGEQLLSIVRALDSAINNTSVILLFECGGKKLLFPGDAQIENWSYALSRPEVKKLLADVDLYKVGHHGSLNATPKSLWNLFHNRGSQPAPGRLLTVNSTMPGKHGDSRAGTEVPRKKLVDALKAESDYFTTESIKGKGNLREDIVVDL